MQDQFKWGLATRVTIYKCCLEQIETLVNLGVGRAGVRKGAVGWCVLFVWTYVHICAGMWSEHTHYVACMHVWPVCLRPGCLSGPSNTHGIVHPMSKSSLVLVQMIYVIHFQPETLSLKLFFCFYYKHIILIGKTLNTSFTIIKSKHLSNIPKKIWQKLATKSTKITHQHKA